ncbi:hypothetical protein Mapa_015824 [Marchantia paleacea]|nr:hypothetical protein Mapa_015824 [Marchantia paleacea]
MLKSSHSIPHCVIWKQERSHHSGHGHTIGKQTFQDGTERRNSKELRNRVDTSRRIHPGALRIGPLLRVAVESPLGLPLVSLDSHGVSQRPETGSPIRVRHYLHHPVDSVKELCVQYPGAITCDKLFGWSREGLGIQAP